MTDKVKFWVLLVLLVLSIVLLFVANTNYNNVLLGK